MLEQVAGRLHIVGVKVVGYASGGRRRHGEMRGGLRR
jgi:hypothetical protein